MAGTIAGELRTVFRKKIKEIFEDGSIQIQASCVFDQDFPAFAGHFPGQPILPAIVQLAAVRLLCEDQLEKVLHPVGCRRVKFRAMVQPGEPVKVQAKVKAGDHCQVSFKLKDGKGQLISSGDLDYSTE